MQTFKRLRTQADRAIAVAAVLLGGLILVIGYFGVSGTGLAAEQIPYIVSGGLGGIFLAGVGAALWLSADLRDEWNKLDRIEEVLRDAWSKTELQRGDGAPFLTVAPVHEPVPEAVLEVAPEPEAVHVNGNGNGKRRQLVAKG